LFSNIEEELRLRVFEKTLLRTKFGPKRDQATGYWRRCIMRSFMICAVNII